jgi:hypothetical protein
MIVDYKPNDAYTLAEEVSSGTNVEFSHSNFQYKVKDEHIIHAYASIFSKYHNVLTPYITEVTLSDEDFYKYYQKPKLLCMDLYGTPELWSGLLYINHMVSAANFTKRKLKVFKSNISNAIEELMTIYNEDLTNNKKEVYKEE